MSTLTNKRASYAAPSITRFGAVEQITEQTAYGGGGTPTGGGGGGGGTGGTGGTGQTGVVAGLGAGAGGSPIVGGTGGGDFRMGNGSPNGAALRHRHH